ncbi:hypothetical protein A2962_04755 [Candidatus Woesebacteria bacterium RIFCSPLOWO2_01_FULL_39_61]|nr:MAG: hypothetical protein A2962_04755 [Candidatus Woesebacteria bacterium RIFCSPLOWO2_01_FULL_39_61]
MLDKLTIPSKIEGFPIFKKITSGFTLIELLTVMSIIAILAAISIFSLNGARESGRDAKRKADLEAVASALELYKADCNYYPNTIPAAGNQFTGTACGLGANIYMEAIPGDPLAGQAYFYEPLSCVVANCTRFRFWAALEDPGTTPSACTGSPTCGGATCNFCVTNP